MRIKIAPVMAASIQFSDLVGLNFALTAQIRGKLSSERVREALRKVKQKHPLLTARVIADKDGLWYETDDNPMIPLDSIDGDWADALPTELPRRFISKSGPQVRFLLSYNGNCTDLAVILSHMVADGMTGAYVLRDVLYYIAHPDEVVHPLPYVPPLEELLPPQDESQVEPMFGQRPEPSESSTGNGPTAPAPLYVIRWLLTVAQTSALTARTRQENVTIHAALCVAFLSAFHLLNLADSSLHCVSSPVSLRNRLTQPVGEHVGNYINSSVRVNLDFVPPRDFWEMAQEIKVAMARGSADDQIFAPIYAFHEMIQSFAGRSIADVVETNQFQRPRADYDLSISNLGRIEMPADFGDFQLEALYGPVLDSLADETIVGVATAAGKLSCSLVSRPYLLPKATAGQIRDIAMDILASAVGW
ncbi:MAG TPA: hypothetical protein VKQ72_06270 [Aggregatilineales bacterium]|nr:hypothetical protein [Aggregatilineales bacterium]